MAPKKERYYFASIFALYVGIRVAGTWILMKRSFWRHGGVKELPTVSMLVACYNHQDFIGDCLQSLASSGYDRLEVIVVDDGSTDDSVARILDWKSDNSNAFYRFQLLQQGNTGPNRALNRALGLATGELIGLLASDDVRVPGSISRQVSEFITNDSLDILYANGCKWYPSTGATGERVHSAETIRLLSESPDVILWTLLTSVPQLFLQSALIRREMLLSVGGYDETVLADDWVLNIRLFRHIHHKSQYSYLDEDVFLYRQHASNAHKDLVTQVDRVIQVINCYTPPSERRRVKGLTLRRYSLAAVAQGRPVLGFRYAVASLLRLPDVMWWLKRLARKVISTAMMT
jgi:glycosyltransferase involved in cell wall biosynthesis